MGPTTTGSGYDFSRLGILVADDSNYMRHIVKLLLMGFGFSRIYEATDGEEALTVLKSHDIDIAIIDWEMPGLSGIDLVRTIRTGGASTNPFMPVIMLTGYSEQSRVLEARDAGVHEFIAKPLAANTLYTRLVSVIEKPRSFVRAQDFFGPDRRRRANPDFIDVERREGVLRHMQEMGSRSLSQDAIDEVMSKD